MYIHTYEERNISYVLMRVSLFSPRANTETSAREVEAQPFFSSSDAVSILARFEPCSRATRLSLSPRVNRMDISQADGSINSRRKLVDTLLLIQGVP